MMKPKKIKKWNKDTVIDKNKLTMFDLISYNPPVTDKQLIDKEAEENKERDEDELSVQKPNLLNLDEEDDEKSDDESVGPRVKINEKGEIVLDEESLIVKRKKPKNQNIKTVYEDDRTISTRTTYSSFKKPGMCEFKFAFKFNFLCLFENLISKVNLMRRNKGGQMKRLLNSIQH